MDTRTIVLAGVPATLEASLREGLAEASISVLTDPTPRREVLRALRPAAAVVAIGTSPEASFRLTAGLSAEGARVIAVGPKDADLIMRAMREGAREYLTPDEPDKIIRSLRDQLRPPRAAGTGSVVAVFPAKGGVGSTVLATNLAGGLARGGDRTCLLDLDLAMGDVMAFLDLSEGYSIADVIANMRRLDKDLLDASVARHASGIHVLAQTQRMEDVAAVDPEAITTLIHFLRQHFKTIVIDGLRTFDDHAVAALDATDVVVLLVSQEVPAVRRAQRSFALLKRLGHDESRVKLVLNRYAKTAEVGTALIEETVGLPIAATISSDYPAVVRAMNRGQLLYDAAPRSRVAKDVDALRDLLMASPEPHEKPSLLKRLFAQKAIPDAT